MNILAIGNSFSQDATRYLHEIALADDMHLKVVNLYIGGCSLETHWNNAVNDLRSYVYELNGVATKKIVSIKEALESDKWDYITLQQVSHLSIDYNTYQPYLYNLSDYIKKNAPHAQQVIHQTWAYEEGSERLTVELGYSNQREMFLDLKSAYYRASKDLGNLKIIPSGESFQIAINNGVKNLYRDGFHASLGSGRYILGAVWYEALTGRSILYNTFREFDEPIDEKEVLILQKSAHEAVARYR